MMQFGFVELLEPQADPILRSFTTQNSLPPDFFRFWSRHFDPAGGPATTEIPTKWTSFFTAALLNPTSFEWAKKFLTSPAWAYFSSSQEYKFSFVLPPKCPSEASSSCLNGNGLRRITELEDLVEATEDVIHTEGTLPDSPPLL